MKHSLTIQTLILVSSWFIICLDFSSVLVSTFCKVSISFFKCKSFSKITNGLRQCFEKVVLQYRYWKCFSSIVITKSFDLIKAFIVIYYSWNNFFCTFSNFIYANYLSFDFCGVMYNSNFLNRKNQYLEIYAIILFYRREILKYWWRAQDYVLAF